MTIGICTHRRFTAACAVILASGSAGCGPHVIVAPPIGPRTIVPRPVSTVSVSAYSRRQFNLGAGILERFDKSLGLTEEQPPQFSGGYLHSARMTLSEPRLFRLVDWYDWELAEWS